MGIGVILNKNKDNKSCSSNSNYGDSLLERVEEKVADAESAAALAQALLESQRVYEGFSLNVLAMHYGIPFEDLLGFEPNEPAQTGKYYAFLRNGLIEIWKAVSPVTGGDPADGGYVRFLLSSEGDGGGDDSDGGGTTPSDGTITVKEITLTNVAVAANSVATNTIEAPDVTTWFMAQVVLNSTSTNLSYNVRIRNQADELIYESVYKNTPLNDKDMLSINEGSMFTIEIENLNQTEALVASFSMKYVVVT